jgi:hypothetical protein
MGQLKPPEIGYKSRIRTSNWRLFRWTGAWLVTTALMTFGPVFLWNKAMVFTLLAVGLNVGVGVGVILANKNYLAELDELQRKVQLNAMGITLGVAMIVGIPFSVMDMYDVIPFRADIAHLMMLLGLTFFVSFLYGSLRYR